MEDLHAAIQKGESVDLTDGELLPARQTLAEEVQKASARKDLKEAMASQDP